MEHAQTDLYMAALTPQESCKDHSEALPSGKQLHPKSWHSNNAEMKQKSAALSPQALQSKGETKATRVPH